MKRSRNKKKKKRKNAKTKKNQTHARRTISTRCRQLNFVNKHNNNKSAIDNSKNKNKEEETS